MMRLREYLGVAAIFAIVGSVYALVTDEPKCDAAFAGFVVIAFVGAELLHAGLAPKEPQP